MYNITFTGYMQRMGMDSSAACACNHQLVNATQSIKVIDSYIHNCTEISNTYHDI